MKIFSATVAASLAAAAAFNYAVDPARYLRKPPFDLTRTWADGEVLVFSAEPNDRALRMAQIVLAPRPDLLLMGSSRMRTVSKSLFAPGLSVFNAGMMGSSMEDHASVWQAFQEQGKLPRRLILYADPWILNANSGQIRWRTNIAVYERFLRRSMGRETLPLKTALRGAWQRLRDAYTIFNELLNWAELRASWAQWRSPSAEPVVSPESSLGEKSLGWRADGSYYEYPKPEPTLEQIRAKALEYAASPEVFSLQRYRIDPAAVETLAALTREAAAAGVKVMLLVPPYQRLALDTFRARPEYAGALPQFLLALEELPGAGVDFDICGSPDPAYAGCGETEFIDGMHLRRSCQEKVLSRCLAPRADWRKILK